MCNLYTKEACQPVEYLSKVITITSETAVGSSTTLRGLQQKLGFLLWRYVSGGALMRVLANSLNLTIEEFAEFNRFHPEAGYDRRCDLDIAELGRHNFTVIEGRLPHVFVPHGFHVRLTCPIEIRAKRRLSDSPGSSLAQIIKKIQHRDEDDNLRYQEMYPGSLWPNDDFDLVVSTEKSPKEVVDLIIESHSIWSQRVNPKQDIVLADANPHLDPLEVGEKIEIERV